MANVILIGIIIFLVAIIIRQKLRQPSQGHAFPLPERIGLHVSNNDIIQFLKNSSESVKSLMEHKGINYKFKCEPESMMG